MQPNRGLEAPRLQNHVFYNGLEAGAVKLCILRGFVAVWARKSLSEGLREVSGGALEAPEAAMRLPLSVKADY